MYNVITYRGKMTTSAPFTKAFHLDCRWLNDNDMKPISNFIALHKMVKVYPLIRLLNLFVLFCVILSNWFTTNNDCNSDNPFLATCK